MEGYKLLTFTATNDYGKEYLAVYLVVVIELSKQEGVQGTSGGSTVKLPREEQHFHQLRSSSDAKLNFYH
jgi:hypothetical protein